MKGSGLMQAIARVNRVWRDKPGGLVVDYIGIGPELRLAIAEYANLTKTTEPPVDFVDNAVPLLLDAVDVIRGMYHGFDYSSFQLPEVAPGWTRWRIVLVCMDRHRSKGTKAVRPPWTRSELRERD
jgi:type I restriction enzyme R subunit